MILPHHKLNQVDYYNLIDDSYTHVIVKSWEKTVTCSVPIKIIRVYWKYNTPPKTLWGKLKELLGFRSKDYTDFTFEAHLEKRGDAKYAIVPKDYFELKNQLKSHFKISRRVLFKN